MLPHSILLSVFAVLPRMATAHLTSNLTKAVSPPPDSNAVQLVALDFTAHPDDLPNDQDYDDMLAPLLPSLSHLLPRDGSRNLTKNVTYPYSAIGRVRWADDTWCTAYLIGVQYAMTSRQCIPLGKPGGHNATFEAGYSREEGRGFESIAEAKVRTAFYPLEKYWEECEPRFDWAVLQLDTCIGIQVGVLGARLFIPEWEPNKPVFETNGYPYENGKGERMMKQERISISDTRGCHGRGPYDTTGDGPFTTNAIAGHGMAGAPLWKMEKNGAYAVGVLSSVAGGKTFFAGGRMWLKELRYVRRLFVHANKED